MSDRLPIVYGRRLSNGSYLEISDSGIRLGVDVLGSAFFMLTRYEELVRSERDPRDRFPATMSLAYRERFLDRPIVNEYAEILWALKRVGHGSADVGDSSECFRPTMWTFPSARAETPFSR